MEGESVLVFLSAISIIFVIISNIQSRKEKLFDNAVSCLQSSVKMNELYSYRCLKTHKWRTSEEPLIPHCAKYIMTVDILTNIMLDMFALVW